MRHEVAQQARAVGEILAPAEVVIGVEPHLLHVFTQPADFAALGGPLDVALSGPILQTVVPFALWVVAHVGTLREHERSHFPLGDQLGGFGKVATAGDLGADLYLALGTFHGVVKLKRFA